MIHAKLDQELQLLHQRVCPALGDPKRILILYALEDGPLCVTEITALLQLPQPTVSRHLAVLRGRGLVTSERKGAAVYYHLVDRRLLRAVDLLREVLQAQVAADVRMAESLA